MESFFIGIIILLIEFSVIIDSSTECAQAAFSFGSASRTRNYDIKVIDYLTTIRVFQQT